MIQRIQSVFLLLASAFCIGLFAADLADTPKPVAESELFADAQYSVFDDPVLLGLFGVGGVLLLIAIFMFNNRPLQMKMALAAAVLLVIAVAFGVYRFATDVAAHLAVPDIGIAFPILAIVFALMARNYIRKDEKLVRSADRLR